MTSVPLLKVQNLRLVFKTLQGQFHALNGVDLELNQGEVVGVVGESGCGKSTLALCTIGLIPQPPARILDGSHLFFKGEDLLVLKEREMEKIRGTGISMIFQEPLTSLNPLLTVGDQLGESVKMYLERSGKLSAKKNERKEQLKSESAAWLRRVGLPDPEAALEKWPHELSGGMRQRIMIAMALAAKPSLILADEPTSAVDVTTQAQILKLTRSLIEEVGTAVMFISHDLAVVAQIADRVAVMYAGDVVEDASANEIYDKPLHPYTQAILASVPKEGERNQRLQIIKGTVPDLKSLPKGCPFSPRCPYAKDECAKEKPWMREPFPGHKVACVLY